jgi:hypothetical protein
VFAVFATLYFSFSFFFKFEERLSQRLYCIALFWNMQSFLQYRRFRATLQAQLERNNLQTTQQHLSQEAGKKESPLPETSSSDGVNELDLERGHTSRNSIEESEEKEDLPRESHESELEKEEEQGHIPENTLSRTTTQQSQGTALGRTLTGVEVRRRKTHEGGEGNVFVVGYEGPNDPMNPKSWSRTKRFAVTFSVASIGCVVGLASSIDSSAVKDAAAEFHVSEVVESMATGLFLIGESSRAPHGNSSLQKFRLTSSSRIRSWSPIRWTFQ